MANECCFDEKDTQNDGVECNGEFISAECVVISRLNEYFNLPKGTKLSTLLDYMTSAIKNANIRIGNRIDFSILPTFSNNTDAVNGGLGQGDPYKTPSGDVKVVI